MAITFLESVGDSSPYTQDELDVLRPFVLAAARQLAARVAAHAAALASTDGSGEWPSPAEVLRDFRDSQIFVMEACAAGYAITISASGEVTFC